MSPTQNETGNKEAIDGNDVEQTVAGEVAHLPGWKLAMVVTSVTLVSFLMLLDSSIIVTAIPNITNQFHSLSDVGWYGSAYLLANCAAGPLAGKIYIHSTLKYAYLSFLCIFEIGSAICGAAQSSVMLIIGRAIAGMGGSGLMNGAIAILSSAAPREKQPLLIGIMMGLSQMAIVLGPLLGGILTQYATWRWCFFINLPCGLVSALLLFIVSIPEPAHSRTANSTSPRRLHKSLDLVGFAIFAGFAVMISLAIEWGGTTYQWHSATIVGFFCGGGLALVTFGLWEFRVGDAVAMIPWSIVRKRQVWTSCFYLGFFSGSMLVYSYYLPIYFQAVKDVSPTLSGVYMLSGIGPQLVMAIGSGVIIGKTGYYLPWAAASAALVSISAGLISTFHPDTSTAKWVMYQFIGGFGRGCGMQTPIIAIQNALSESPAQATLGISLAIFAQTFFGGLFLNLAALVFSSGLSDGIKKYAPSVHVDKVVVAGATGFREVVAKNEVQGVVKAYSLGVDHVFYLAVGAAAIMFVLSLGMGWHPISKKEGAANPAGTAAPGGEENIA